MNQEKNQYSLDVRMENQTPIKIDVIDTVTAGLDPRNDLVLVGNKIKPKQLIFEQKGENLALHYVGHTNQTFLNSIPLEENKTYLLDSGDRIQLTGVEIIIRHELVYVNATKKSKPIAFNSLEELTPESVKDSLIYADNPTGSLRRQPHVRPPVLSNTSSTPLVALWTIKAYALLADVFFTYLFLVVGLPLVFADHYALEIFNYFATLISPNGSHSFLNFFIAWYLLSFAQTLVFGSTLGQFFLGLSNNPDNTFGRLILFRMKTFVYSLFLLPAQNTVKTTLIFKGIRKVGIIFIFVFILISPFFLPSPFNSALTLIENHDEGTRDLHTRSLIDHSKDLGMFLSTELSYRYYLLPYILAEGKRAFQFIDLKTNESIIINQTEDFTYDNLQAQLEYGNPLYTSLHKTSLSQSTLKNKKETIENILLLSPVHLRESASALGPFFGSAILLKEILLDESSTSTITLKNYLPETPVLFFSTSQQDFFYLFGSDRLSRFNIESKKRGPIVSVFEKQILTKLEVSPISTSNSNAQAIGLLEAQDAFLHGDEQTFLTYYVGVANSLSNVKIIHANVDFTDQAKLAVIKNIEAVQKFIKDKNVYKSFNDIKNQLAPMEKPGEKR